MTKEKFKIYEHDILKQVLLSPENKSITEKITVNEDGSYILKTKLTDKESFIRELNILLQEIAFKLEDLNYSTIFIGSFPNSWKSKMNRNDYIIYHLEFFYISIQSIFDRVLHLINFLYNLGLSDRHAKIDIITSNSNIDDKTKKILNEFNKRIEGIRRVQNEIKHKSKLKVGELNEISIYEFVFNNDNNLPELKESLLKYKIRRDYKKFIKNKRKEMIKNIEAMDILVKISLDTLYPQFKKRIKEFN